VSADGRKAITGANDGMTRIFDLKTGKELAQLAGHKSSVWGVALSADGRHAVTGGWDKSLRYWDVENARVLVHFAPVTEKIRCLALSPDGKIVAVGHFGDEKVPTGTVRLWNVENGKEIRELRGHTREISSISFSTDGTWLLTSSFDSSVRVWNVADGKLLKQFIGHKSRVECAAFVDGGKRVLFGGNEKDPTLQLWDIEQNRQVRCSQPLSGGFLGVAALSDGNAVTACRDGTVRFWRWRLTTK
jgi:WD40 repeat protein